MACLALACGTVSQRPGRVETIVLIGDSISVGAGASSPQHAYAWRLERELSPWYRVVNYSRGGWTVVGRTGLASPASVRGAVELWPNVVVIALGTNDYVSDVSLRKFAAGYRAALNKLSSVATVVCVTPYRRSDRSEARPNAVGLLPNAYREAVRSVCEERGRIVLDGFEALPSESYLADGLHPNDAGHQRIAEWLEQRLIEILDRTERARVDPG